ncbi:hypothetical protein K0U91_11175 [Chryseobacterium chendengshani]|uniref:hypothetical protein n=1 Tax=Chryseobacterium sp. LJ668 TaxID=2864040 RepID=UPI001C68AE59|nr:hypothetical protein [Chryseobacterium sp. LJ668]MBW8523332.1 hypothetical protein [Chryseobacterium sp. LJ668]QYK15624.1 hypothetical protein K0U91_11175 [Chryseobacterium sp. LJ668]
MDNSFKYKLLKLQDKNIFDLVKDFEKKGETPLKIILSIRKLFPKLSLVEAKEIMIIGTTKYKSLHDFQDDLFNFPEEEFEIAFKNDNYALYDKIRNLQYHKKNPIDIIYYALSKGKRLIVAIGLLRKIFPEITLQEASEIVSCIEIDYSNKYEDDKDLDDILKDIEN